MCRLAFLALVLVSIIYPIDLGTSIEVQVANDLLGFDKMYRVKLATSAPPPLRMSNELGSDEESAEIPKLRSAALLKSNSRFDVDSFCNMIHRAIPKEVRDGKFIIEPDLSSSSDVMSPVALPPPSGFIPKMGLPKIKSPRLNVPTLKVPQLKYLHGHLKAPKVGKPMLLLPWRREDESSAEKVERFKKGVQKMLNFVKILGKIDKYLSERTRIVVDKLSMTLAE